MTSYTKNLDLLGTDLRLRYAGSTGSFENADVDVVATTVTHGQRRHFDMVEATELDAADQLLANRLQTRKGELAPLGHPEYGSRHHELIGQPNIERTRNLIKLHVLEALRHESRIEEIVSCDVTAAHDPPRSVVRLSLVISIIGEQVPRNLVLPFSLEIGAG